MVPSLGLALCAIWLLLTCRFWSAEAAYRQFSPDWRLRNLAAPRQGLSGEQVIELARHAAAAVPASPDYQWGLGDRLVQFAYPAAHRDPDRAATVIDEAIRAYIRSLWSRPAQPQVLFDLLKAAQEVYLPDHGPEPDILIDLAVRANNLAPYSAGLRLEIADWYLSQWPNLTRATRVRVKDQVQATLKFATTQRHVRQQYEQTAATLNRLLQTTS